MTDIKKWIYAFPVIFSLAIIVITVISWLGSVYGWQMNNLISENGLRWFIAYFMLNIKQAPWEYIILFSCTISIVKESDILNLKRKQIFLKQKRAYMFTVMMAGAIIIFMTVFMLMSGNMVLSAFGTFNNSPLQNGLVPIFLFFIILLSITFGYASGRFANFEEMIKASVNLIANIAGYFVTFIIAAQLFAIINYVLFDAQPWTDRMTTIYYTVAFIVFWIPWILHVFYAYKKKP